MTNEDKNQDKAQAPNGGGQPGDDGAKSLRRAEKALEARGLAIFRLDGGLVGIGKAEDDLIIRAKIPGDPSTVAALADGVVAGMNANGIVAPGVAAPGRAGGLPGVLQALLGKLGPGVQAVPGMLAIGVAGQRTTGPKKAKHDGTKIPCCAEHAQIGLADMAELLRGEDGAEHATQVASEMAAILADELKNGLGTTKKASVAKAGLAIAHAGAAAASFAVAHEAIQRGVIEATRAAELAAALRKPARHKSKGRARKRRR